MNLNKVLLIGRLGKDPEIKYTSGGEPICHFSLATSEKWKDKNGLQHEKTSWHNISAFRKLAEVCNEYLRKGSLIHVEGKLDYREYEKDGQKRQALNVVASDITFLEARKDKVDSPSEVKTPPQAAKKPLPDNSAFGGHNYSSPPVEPPLRGELFQHGSDYPTYSTRDVPF